MITSALDFFVNSIGCCLKTMLSLAEGVASIATETLFGFSAHVVDNVLEVAELGVTYILNILIF